EIPVADFSRLATHAKFLAFMPQWEFLDFVRNAASAFSTFELRMETEVKGLIDRDGQVVGVVVDSPQGQREIHADLVIGADGRHSTVREKAGLPIQDLGAPIDVLWMNLPRSPDDPSQPFGIFDR